MCNTTLKYIYFFICSVYVHKLSQTLTTAPIGNNYLTKYCFIFKCSLQKWDPNRWFSSKELNIAVTKNFRSPWPGWKVVKRARFGAWHIRCRRPISLHKLVAVSLCLISLFWDWSHSHAKDKKPEELHRPPQYLHHKVDLPNERIERPSRRSRRWHKTDKHPRRVRQMNTTIGIVSWTAPTRGLLATRKHSHLLEQS